MYHNIQILYQHPTKMKKAIAEQSWWLCQGRVNVELRLAMNKTRRKPEHYYRASQPNPTSNGMNA